MSNVEHLFTGYLYVFFGEMFTTHFLTGLLVFFSIELNELLVYFGD